MTKIFELPSETMTKLVDAYCSVWAMSDATSRRQQLDRVWSAEATYTDPTLENAGAEAFLSHLSALATEHPGARVERISSLDSHHGFARFQWKLVLSDGTTLIDGTDFLDFAADGRIERIIGFFGAHPS